VINWADRVVPYPPEFADLYRSRGLWRGSTVAEEFHTIALAHPGQTAVVDESVSMTFTELDEASDVLASGLHRLGLMPGGPVVVQLTNKTATVVAWYGLLKAGLIPVCTLAAHRQHEIGSISRKVNAVAHLVEHTGAGFDLVAFAVEQTTGHPTMNHVLTLGAPAGSPGTRIEDLIASGDAEEARRTVEGVQSSIDPDDVAVFQLSGGTTGVPKIIPRLHAEYWYNARAYAQARGWDSGERVAHLIPIIHNAGITCGLHAAHAVGGALVLGTANLDQALPVMVREQATAILVGHAHYNMTSHPLFDDVATALQQAIFSGAKVPEHVFAAFEAHDVKVGQKFGMGEGLFTITPFDAPRELRLTTVGMPISDLDEFKVVNSDSLEEVAPGEVGELICRGPYTIRGYFDAAEINATAFTDDGYYRTGDLVKRTLVEGHPSISMEGRIKDLINRGGEKISAEEVEGLLVRHPRIASAAVVPMPDERLGERACAVVVANGAPMTMAEVQAHLSALGVAKFKWPERLVWIDEMPKTQVGKLDKNKLRLDLNDEQRLADA
jgi:2,3-dihydroxybenzoate-AMP ligase